MKQAVFQSGYMGRWLALLALGVGMLWMPLSTAQSADTSEQQEAEVSEQAEETQQRESDNDERKWGWGERRGEGDSSDRPRPMADREKAREYIEDVMLARVSKALDLDDEKSLLLLRRFKEHREESMELFKERHKAVTAMREAVEAGDEEESVAFLEKMLALDKQLFEHRQALIMDPELELDRMQRAKLYLFFQDFEENMRRVLRQVHRQRDSEFPPPPPGEEGRGPGRPDDRPDRRNGEGPDRGPMAPERNR